MPAPREAEVVRDADLSRLSTFRLPARAAELVVIEHPDQLAGLAPPASDELVLGGGSNTVFIGDFPGRVVLDRMRGLRFEETGDTVRVSAAAGENWHRLVRECLRRGLHGIENLAMIPGSVGAAPMQNIGAYGIELAECFEFLQALDRRSGEMVRLEREDCGFGYRDSRFKSADRGRFLITEVSLGLSRNFRPQTGYASLSEELARVGAVDPTPRQLTAAIMRLRRHRLPDPGRLANSGSFFKNPVLAASDAEALLAEYPALPHWPMPDGRAKLAAAWMIERLGWKGRSLGDAGVYRNHALVLVNHGRATAADLLRLIEAITDSVERHFGIRLEPEPMLVGR
ncbi:MAG: UDP-N-acetylmuramate dehydrogenase [Gammaproteobacteria bacterium]|jgi:UDP-N-acetylmuramate dehydrogenase|nr:UDP-N-acetylmuramate dehydrogenase [Gammaproteobacteria bacterium]